MTPPVFVVHAKEPKTVGVMLADAGTPGIAEAEVMDCQTGL